VRCRTTTDRRVCGGGAVRRCRAASVGRGRGGTPGRHVGGRRQGSTDQGPVGGGRRGARVPHRHRRCGRRGRGDRLRRGWEGRQRLRDRPCGGCAELCGGQGDRKSTRLNSSHVSISYAVFCLKK